MATLLPAVKLLTLVEILAERLETEKRKSEYELAYYLKMDRGIILKQLEELPPPPDKLATSTLSIDPAKKKYLSRLAHINNEIAFLHKAYINDDSTPNAAINVKAMQYYNFSYNLNAKLQDIKKQFSSSTLLTDSIKIFNDAIEHINIILSESTGLYTKLENIKKMFVQKYSEINKKINLLKLTIKNQSSLDKNIILELESIITQWHELDSLAGNLLSCFLAIKRFHDDILTIYNRYDLDKVIKELSKELSSLDVKSELAKELKDLDTKLEDSKKKHIIEKQKEQAKELIGQSNIFMKAHNVKDILLPISPPLSSLPPSSSSSSTASLSSPSSGAPPGAGAEASPGAPPPSSSPPPPSSSPPPPSSSSPPSPPGASSGASPVLSISSSAKLPTTSTELKVLTWKIKTYAQVGNLPNIKDALKVDKYDIVGLQLEQPFLGEKTIKELAGELGFYFVNYENQYKQKDGKYRADDQIITFYNPDKLELVAIKTSTFTHFIKRDIGNWNNAYQALLFKDKEKQKLILFLNVNCPDKNNDKLHSIFTLGHFQKIIFENLSTFLYVVKQPKSTVISTITIKGNDILDNKGLQYYAPYDITQQKKSQKGGAVDYDIHCTQKARTLRGGNGESIVGRGRGRGRGGFVSRGRGRGRGRGGYENQGVIKKQSFKFYDEFYNAVALLFIGYWGNLKHNEINIDYFDADPNIEKEIQNAKTKLKPFEDKLHLTRTAYETAQKKEDEAKKGGKSDIKEETEAIKKTKDEYDKAMKEFNAAQKILDELEKNKKDNQRQREKIYELRKNAKILTLTKQPDKSACASGKNENANYIVFSTNFSATEDSNNKVQLTCVKGMDYLPVFSIVDYVDETSSSGPQILRKNKKITKQEIIDDVGDNLVEITLFNDRVETEEVFQFGDVDVSDKINSNDKTTKSKWQSGCNPNNFKTFFVEMFKSGNKRFKYIDNDDNKLTYADHIFQRRHTQDCIESETMLSTNREVLCKIFGLLSILFNTFTNKIVITFCKVDRFAIAAPTFFIENINDIFLRDERIFKNQHNQTYKYKFNLLNILYNHIDFNKISLLFELYKFLLSKIPGDKLHVGAYEANNKIFDIDDSAINIFYLNDLIQNIDLSDEKYKDYIFTNDTTRPSCNMSPQMNKLVVFIKVVLNDIVHILDKNTNCNGIKFIIQNSAKPTEYVNLEEDMKKFSNKLLPDKYKNYIDFALKATEAGKLYRYARLGLLEAPSEPMPAHTTATESEPAAPSNAITNTKSATQIKLNFGLLTVDNINEFNNTFFDEYNEFMIFENKEPTINKYLLDDEKELSRLSKLLFSYILYYLYLNVYNLNGFKKEHSILFKQKDNLILKLFVILLFVEYYFDESIKADKLLKDIVYDDINFSSRKGNYTDILEDVLIIPDKFSESVILLAKIIIIFFHKHKVRIQKLIDDIKEVFPEKKRDEITKDKNAKLDAIAGLYEKLSPEDKTEIDGKYQITITGEKGVEHIETKDVIKPKPQNEQLADIYNKCFKDKPFAFLDEEHPDASNENKRAITEEEFNTLFADLKNKQRIIEIDDFIELYGIKKSCETAQELYYIYSYVIKHNHKIANQNIPNYYAYEFDEQLQSSYKYLIDNYKFTVADTLIYLQTNITLFTNKLINTYLLIYNHYVSNLNIYTNNILNQLNYKIQETGGSGHCFFYSIAYQVYYQEWANPTSKLASQYKVRQELQNLIVEFTKKIGGIKTQFTSSLPEMPEKEKEQKWDKHIQDLKIFEGLPILTQKQIKDIIPETSDNSTVTSQFWGEEYHIPYISLLYGKAVLYLSSKITPGIGNACYLIEWGNEPYAAFNDMTFNLEFLKAHKFKRTFIDFGNEPQVNNIKAKLSIGNVITLYGGGGHWQALIPITVATKIQPKVHVSAPALAPASSSAPAPVAVAEPVVVAAPAPSTNSSIFNAAQYIVKLDADKAKPSAFLNDGIVYLTNKIDRIKITAIKYIPEVKDNTGLVKHNEREYFRDMVNQEKAKHCLFIFNDNIAQYYAVHDPQKTQNSNKALGIPIGPKDESGFPNLNVKYDNTGEIVKGLGKGTTARTHIETAIQAIVDAIKARSTQDNYVNEIIYLGSNVNIVEGHNLNVPGLASNIDSVPIVVKEFITRQIYSIPSSVFKVEVTEGGGLNTNRHTKTKQSRIIPKNHTKKIITIK